jgi:hypothetical protein
MTAWNKLAWIAWKRLARHRDWISALAEARYIGQAYLQIVGTKTVRVPWSMQVKWESGVKGLQRPMLVV